MKHLVRITSIIFCSFVLFGAANGQVIFDFEDGTAMGFYDNGWGTGFTSVAWAADPTGQSSGVLALQCDATQGDKGVMQVDNLDPMGAPIINFWVYLPADFPDDAQITLWGQDNANWSGWNASDYAGSALPKETWVPVNFQMEFLHVKDPGTFNPYEGNKLGKFGLQVYFGTSNTTWTGTVLVDNGALVGIEPDVFADFEDGTAMGFYDNGWGAGFTSVAYAADPTGRSTGVLALSCDATQGEKGVIQLDNLDPMGVLKLEFYIYLPADFPDDGQITLWGQDNANWSGWNATDYAGSALPKETWVPVVFEMTLLHLKDPGTFNPFDGNKLGKFGLQVYFGSTNTTWAGTVYVDDGARLSEKVGKQWVVADFEHEAAGLQDFVNTGWGAALTSMEWAADPTGRSVGVMKTDFDFNLDVKGTFENGNVNPQWTDTDTGATAITMDIWIPADILLDSAQVKIFARDHDTWTWTENSYIISDTTIVPGQWNTLTYDLLAHVEAGDINPQAVLSVGCELFYPETKNWTGIVYWDNFTLIGVEAPVGEITSPTVIAEVDTSDEPEAKFYYNHISWVDNTVPTTYSVYMSESPINSLSDDGVIRIGRQIPDGTQEWNHRPFTSDGSEKTLYYAVTAKKEDGTETELTEDCKTGPLTLQTSPTAKMPYVANFADQFVLDGLDTEFADYKQYTIIPERAGGDEAEGWTPTSTDYSWHVTFVIDDNYLYISADVTDDDMNASGGEPIVPGSQAWMGDALEFYIGYYNANLLDAWHGYKDVDAEGTGDWRISYTAWGTTERSGYQPFDFPGVENVVFQKFTGDGFIIEVKIELDSLAMGNDITIVDGMRMPLRVDGTDMDPSNGDESRTLYTTWGNMWNQEDWFRPSTWGFMEVVGGPTSVDNSTLSSPLEFRLHANYPNPFNPSTTLKYEIPTSSEVSMVIYDLLGNKIRTLVHAKKQAGVYTVQWDGKDDMGKAVPSGVYFCKMNATDYHHVEKMTLLK